jgi:hypothetical protein
VKAVGVEAFTHWVAGEICPTHMSEDPHYTARAHRSPATWAALRSRIIAVTAIKE